MRSSSHGRESRSDCAGGRLIEHSDSGALDDALAVLPKGQRQLRLEIRNAETLIERKPEWI